MNTQIANPNKCRPKIDTFLPIKMQTPKKIRSLFLELKKFVNGEASDQKSFENAASLSTLYETKKPALKTSRTSSGLTVLGVVPQKTLSAGSAGKNLPRPISIDQWTSDCTVPDLRWIADANLDLSEDHEFFQRGGYYRRWESSRSLS